MGLDERRRSEGQPLVEGDISESVCTGCIVSMSYRAENSVRGMLTGIENLEEVQCGVAGVLDVMAWRELE